MIHDIYQRARETWDAGSALRRRRQRFKNYTYGRQWDDVIRTPTGEWMTEGEYAATSGKYPLTNNMIRQLIKSVIGRYRHTLASASVGERPAKLAEAAARNMLDELDCRALEEFLISGCAVQRVVSERRLDSRARVWVDNVSPGRFFVNRFSDPRGSDIEIVGMLHDMSIHEALMRYSHGDSSRSRLITEALKRSSMAVGRGTEAVGEESDAVFASPPSGRCRIIEAWVREPCTLLRCHDRSRGRWFYIDASQQARLAELNERLASRGASTIAATRCESFRWHGYYFTGGGELIDDTVSPYRHGGHPFVVKFYPLTDGEVHPFVEDIIDSQRYINRLITMMDHIMSFSAKGVLLFPEDQKPDNMSWDQITAQWSRTNGIIPYRSSLGVEPKQIYSSGNTTTPYELLGLEMKLFEQISGVSGALQGEAPAGNQSASLYESRVQNAAISLLDIFDTFSSFRAQRDSLILNI